MSRHLHAKASGTVREIRLRPGDPIGAGEPVVVLACVGGDAAVEAPASGVIASIDVAVGDAVLAGQRIASLEPLG